MSSIQALPPRWGVVPPTGSHVVVRPQRRNRWIDGTGLVVGPDQRYFPRPTAVFVAFPTGMTTLIDVADLMITATPGPTTHPREDHQ